MQLKSLPIGQVAGHILVHNIAGDDGRKVLKKGIVLTDGDVETLRRMGYGQLDVAVLDEDDVAEDEAAERVAAVLAQGSDGPALLPMRATRGVGGRVNLHVEQDGILYVESPGLFELNTLPGVTLATRPRFALVGPS